MPGFVRLVGAGRLPLGFPVRYRASAVAGIASLIALEVLAQESTTNGRPLSTATPVQSSAAAVTSPIESNLRNDAALADVVFIDRANGWAVGDRGVIWHTNNGGATWVQQSSGVCCRLSGVCFVDAQHGWAVGGECRPLTHVTQGIVLRTTNGGATWTAVRGLLLPMLTRVKFFDHNLGLAIGLGSTSQPSGVFVTRDGGTSWQTLPTDRSDSWLAGDFSDVDTGALAGPAGRFATIARRQVVHSPLAAPSLRSFQDMQLLAPTAGWLVGDGGIVMMTRDAGRSWQSPLGELPNNADEHFDFRAVAAHGQHVWVAGSPGTRVFHSSDGGQSWQASATGHTPPIQAMSFVDAQHGWAVGDLGRILATKDGGRAWQGQRAGGTRAALVAVFAEATDVPLELVAQIGAADGYITAVETLPSAAGSDDQIVPDRIRTGDAALLAGAATADAAWRFPLPAQDLALSPTDLLAALNRANDGRAVQQLERHLVQRLRMWRPDVVVTHCSNASAQQASDPAAMLVEQAVHKAVAAAADPAQFTELASTAGLASWQVKKVYGVLPPGMRGDEQIDTGRFSPHLGAALADAVAPARRLLFTHHASIVETIELKLLLSTNDISDRSAGLFGGISIAHGSDARRPAPEFTTDNFDALRQLAARRQQLQELLERTEGNAAWAGQVATLTEGLDANGGGELLFQLAEGYQATGNLDLAADTFYLLARRYPEHPLADTALRWLVQFYASGEAAHRLSHGQTNLRGGDFDKSDSDSGVLRTRATSLAEMATPHLGLSRDDRLRRAVQLTEFFRTARPHLYVEPAVRFAEVSAQRRLGFPNEATRYFLTLGQLPDSNPWRQCAATEQWLAKPNETPPPKALATCRRTTTPPLLDGRLDEPFWQTADVLRLRTAAAASAGENPSAGEPHSTGGKVRLCYDQENLYVAITCPKLADVDYPSDDRPRPRDADLVQYDRVAVQLDADRDFTTAYELVVDHRGWCHDACWDDTNWNPSWYIAAADDETTWTVEAAIPLAELTDARPAARHVWAIGARRTIPSVGHRSWTGEPSATDSPDRFGLLIFE